jgi:hypothetical protein
MYCLALTLVVGTQVARRPGRQDGVQVRAYPIRIKLTEGEGRVLAF